ncbi:MAG: hypothetical protein FWF59_09220 [Turicibacter sp.]|nr:hypothetical protein [Turicibacter sp.]
MAMKFTLETILRGSYNYSNQYSCKLQANGEYSASAFDGLFEILSSHISFSP